MFIKPLLKSNDVLKEGLHHFIWKVFSSFLDLPMENLQGKDSYYIYKLYCEKHKFVRKTNTIASTYSKLNYAPKNKNMLHMINTTAPLS